jgi:cellulose biosynthesis protein BcsQ
MLLGPGPNILDKHNGNITNYGSANSEKEAVIDYCNKNRYNHNILPNTQEKEIKSGMSENELNDFFENLETEIKEKFDYEDDSLSQDKIDEIIENN